MEPDKTTFDRCEYLLPPGCKDLVDKLHLAQMQSRRRPRPRPREKPTVYLPLRLTVRELAINLRATLPAIIKLLKGMKVFTSVDQKIPFYTASKVAAVLGYQAKKKGC